MILKLDLETSAVYFLEIEVNREWLLQYIHAKWSQKQTKKKPFKAVWYNWRLNSCVENVQTARSMRETINLLTESSNMANLVTKE